MPYGIVCEVDTEKGLGRLRTETNAQYTFEIDDNKWAMGDNVKFKPGPLVTGGLPSALNLKSVHDRPRPACSGPQQRTTANQSTAAGIAKMFSRGASVRGGQNSLPVHLLPGSVQPESTTTAAPTHCRTANEASHASTDVLLADCGESPLKVKEPELKRGRDICAKLINRKHHAAQGNAQRQCATDGSNAIERPLDMEGAGPSSVMPSSGSTFKAESICIEGNAQRQCAADRSNAFERPSDMKGIGPSSVMPPIGSASKDESICVKRQSMADGSNAVERQVEMNGSGPQSWVPPTVCASSVIEVCDDDDEQPFEKKIPAAEGPTKSTSSSLAAQGAASDSDPLKQRKMLRLARPLVSPPNSIDLDSDPMDTGDSQDSDKCLQDLVKDGRSGASAARPSREDVSDKEEESVLAAAAKAASPGGHAPCVPANEATPPQVRSVGQPPLAQEAIVGNEEIGTPPPLRSARHGRPVTSRGLDAEGQQPSQPLRRARQSRRPRGTLAPEPVVPAATVEVAAEVTHAFTVQGAQLALAMLHGYKILENRSFRLKLGWHALHIGNKPRTEHGLRAAEIYPNLPRDKDLPGYFGAVVGLLRISEHRVPSQCGSVDWALGPLCNVISHAMLLRRPIAQTGQLGCWKLSPDAREEMRQQVFSLGSAGIKGFDLAPLGPRPAGPLGFIRKRQAPPGSSAPPIVQPSVPGSASSSSGLPPAVGFAPAAGKQCGANVASAPVLAPLKTTAAGAAEAPHALSGRGADANRHKRQESSRRRSRSLHGLAPRQQAEFRRQSLRLPRGRTLGGPSAHGRGQSPRASEAGREGHGEIQRVRSRAAVQPVPTRQADPPPKRKKWLRDLLDSAMLPAGQSKESFTAQPTTRAQHRMESLRQRVKQKEAGASCQERVEPCQEAPLP